jgi:LacI family transcriptional regulator
MIRLIILSDFTEAFAHKLLRGIMEYSRQTEPWAVCRMPPAYKVQTGIEGVLAWAGIWKADAIIGQFNDDDPIEFFEKNGIVVVAQDFNSRFERITNITSDYLLTGQMAADFFLRKGFRNFAFYGYKKAVWSDERFEGFRRCLCEAGYENNIYEYNHQPLGSLWYYQTEPVSEWIVQLPKPVALLTCDDNQGNKIAEVCKLTGIRIPQDVAVLGVDNDETICDLTDPPLSSISLSIEKAGYETARQIELLVRGRAAGRQDVVIHPCCIINRASTDLFATNDEYVSQALRYIHAHLGSKLTVDGIVKNLPLSRRLFEMRFRKITGMPVYQYIWNERIEKFIRTLLATEKSIAEILMETGEIDYHNFSRIFRKMKGCSPTCYRKYHKV